MPTRRVHRPGLAALALLVSLLFQVGGLYLFERFRPIPAPAVTVELVGEGAGQVAIPELAALCRQRCSSEGRVGLVLALEAVADEESVFAGWSGCAPDDRDPRRCTLRLTGRHLVAARFDPIPEQVEVSWLTPPKVPRQDQPEPVSPALVVPALPPEIRGLTRVELSDPREVDEAPDDARFLSDKNRDVEEETQARERERLQSEMAASGDEDPTSDSTASADSQEARSALLSMRGRGGDERSTASEDPGETLAHDRIDGNDYRRIMGDETVRAEVAEGRRRQSAQQSRAGRKRAGIAAALENFVTGVRVGNQTALKTRADPFAVYIARMHRKIHARWGFGLLEEWDRRPASDALNNWELETVIEIAIDSDGEISRTALVNRSGLTVFDVAALDVIYAASPYDPPSRNLASPDGLVYMHWVFRRDNQQCGTFNVRPYILDGSASSAVGGASAASTTPTTPPARNRAAPIPAPHVDVDRREATHTANVWMRALANRSVPALVRVSTVPFVSNGRTIATRARDLNKIYHEILAELEGQTIRSWTLLSRLELVRRDGHLPGGAQGNDEPFWLDLQTSRDRLFLSLVPGPQGWIVKGLHR